MARTNDRQVRYGTQSSVLEIYHDKRDGSRIRWDWVLKYSALVVLCFALGFGGGWMLRRADRFSEVPARPTLVPSDDEISAEVPAP